MNLPGLDFQLGEDIDALRDCLAMADIRPPKVPVVNNIDVASVSEPEGIRDALYRQAFAPPA